MAQRLARLLPYLRKLTAPPDSDADLLDRFVRVRDEEAFSTLVGRHGPMVFRVCRRVLGEADAAEDAFQATFLVLVRRAGSVGRPSALAGWLYGVASRVALKARAAAARHRPRQGDLPDPPDPRPDPLATLSTRELLAVLEEELRRLPERYRTAVVLCCLEGLTLDEAAQKLGCSNGALRGWLERGRARLHKRLARRGVTGTAALAAVEVARGTAGAGLPATLAQQAAQAALRYTMTGTATAGVVSANISLLTEGVLRTMWLTKLCWGLVLLLAVGSVGAMAGVMLGQAGVLTPPTQGEAGPMVLAQAPPPRPDPDPVTGKLGPTENVTQTGKTGNPWTKRLANGVMVELLGVSFNPSKPGSWWRPDGSPLDVPPYEKQGGRVHPSPAQQAREFAVRLRNLPEGSPSVLWEFRPEGYGSSASGTAEKGGRVLADVAPIAVAFPSKQEACTVRFGVAAGPWKAEASGRGGEAQGGDQLAVIFGTARPVKGGTAITVSHSPVDRALRLVVVDTDGKTRSAGRVQTGGAGKIVQIDAEFDVPPDRVREFRLQGRPYEWAEFPDVRLNLRKE